MKYDSAPFSRLSFVLESRDRIWSCANSSEACCFKDDRLIGWGGVGRRGVDGSIVLIKGWPHWGQYLAFALSLAPSTRVNGSSILKNEVIHSGSHAGPGKEQRITYASDTNLQLGCLHFRELWGIHSMSAGVYLIFPGFQLGWEGSLPLDCLSEGTPLWSRWTAECPRNNLPIGWNWPLRSYEFIL